MVDVLGGSVVPLVALFGLVLAVGLSVPVPSSASVPWSRQAFVVVAGIGAFVLGRAAGGAAPAASSTAFLALNAFAAVAEEAFFRRGVFGLLQRHGDLTAVVGSAVLFGLVHVAVYGAWVLPIDIAAGLLFGWQRLAARTWVAPAVTHVIANVLVLR